MMTVEMARMIILIIMVYGLPSLLLVQPLP